MRKVKNQRSKPTEKMLAFAKAYLSNGRNGQKAYAAAYGQHDSSPQCIGERITRVLRHPGVAPIIERADAAAQVEVDKAIAAYALSKGKIAQELCHLAFSNIMDFISWDSERGLGRLDLSGLTKAQAAAIKEFTVDQIGTSGGTGVNR